MIHIFDSICILGRDGVEVCDPLGGGQQLIGTGHRHTLRLQQPIHGLGHIIAVHGCADAVRIIVFKGRRGVVQDPLARQQGDCISKPSLVSGHLAHLVIVEQTGKHDRELGCGHIDARSKSAVAKPGNDTPAGHVLDGVIGPVGSRHIGEGGPSGPGRDGQPQAQTQSQRNAQDSVFHCPFSP